MEIGPSLEEPGANVVDRKGSIDRGRAVIEAEENQTMLNRPGQADQFAKGKGGIQDVRLRGGIINGEMDPGKVADATAATDKGERFKMTGGSVLKVGTGETSSTEVGAAEAAKDLSGSTGGGPRGIRDQINLVDAQRKSADTRIRELIDLSKAEAANVYSPQDKKEVNDRYKKEIDNERRRRDQLDALFAKLNDQLFSGAAQTTSAGKTGAGKATPPANAAGVNSTWQEYLRMKGGGR